jgi:alpha-L-fucosidase
VDGKAQQESSYWPGGRAINPNDSNDLTIGINLINPNPKLGEVGASFDGLMDDVLIFNGALSPDQVRQLFESPSSLVFHENVRVNNSSTANQNQNPIQKPDESKLKYGLCINFGLPTFAGPGEQGELPASRFAPAGVNVKSWARAAKAAGMTFAMPLVNSAGFCLWPTADDDYDIAHSPFKGDILGDFIAACNAEGVLPGAYYFVSNPHNEGAGRAASPVSNLSFNFIKKQIAELHTKYPGLRVQIFNGSNRFSAEQWAELVQLLHDVNPQCLILDGNHEGVTQHMGGTVLRNYKWQPNAEFVPVAELFRRYEEAQTAKKSLLLTVGADLSGNIPDNQISVLLALKDLVRTSSSAAH